MYNRIGSLSKSELQDIANRVESVAGMIRELGYKSGAGGSYSVVKKYLQLHQIETDHWKGQAWSKDQRLKEWKNYSGHQSLKRHLLQERARRCQNCGNCEWLNHPIPIEVHHIDGNRTNNQSENLLLLCPNCHSITDNWKGRNKK